MKPKPKSAIPFVVLFDGPDAMRNIDLALADPRTPPNLRKELQRYKDNPIAATAADQQVFMDRAAKAVPLQSGRAPGSRNKITEKVRAHIHELMKKHPRLTTGAQLYRVADRSMIGRMAAKTFADHVRTVRKK